MPAVNKIIEEKGIERLLKKRELLKQYKKAKTYLLTGNAVSVKFKERRPRGSGIYYFRINKQYRAICYFRKNEVLAVVDIDNHSK